MASGSSDPANITTNYDAARDAGEINQPNFALTRDTKGSRGLALPGVPDARPVERWVLTAGLLFLIGGGLFPAKVLRLRVDAAEAIAQTATAAADLPGSFF